MILIESSHWRLWSEPASGVQWMGAQVKRHELWYDVVPDCRPDVNQPAAGQSAEAPLPAANFHMIPYSNRIRDARFTFRGEHVQLENAAAHAIHGALRKAALASHRGRSEFTVVRIRQPDVWRDQLAMAYSGAH